MQEISTADERQHHDLSIRKKRYQDTTSNTNRPTSTLSDTASSLMYESMDGSNDDKDVFVTAPKTPAERPHESKDSIAINGRQHHDVQMNRNQQDTTYNTHRPTSILSDTDSSSQRYESMDGSDEIYTFVTAPTTPAERPGQEHQNPLPLLTDVSSRLRSMQASHSPPQPVYSYCVMWCLLKQASNQIISLITRPMDRVQVSLCMVAVPMHPN